MAGFLSALYTNSWHQVIHFTTMALADFRAFLFLRGSPAVSSDLDFSSVVVMPRIGAFLKCLVTLSVTAFETSAAESWAGKVVARYLLLLLPLALVS